MEVMAGMTTHAMTMIHLSQGRLKKAPLAFSPCFYLGLCAKTAVKANMGDAVLAAVSGFQEILLSQSKDVHTTSDTQARVATPSTVQIDPFQVMVSAKKLPTEHIADYSFVFAD
jgi:hypothetical protein